jgi:hypothetical protein
MDIADSYFCWVIMACACSYGSNAVIGYAEAYEESISAQNSAEAYEESFATQNSVNAYEASFL